MARKTLKGRNRKAANRVTRKNREKVRGGVRNSQKKLSSKNYYNNITRQFPNFSEKERRNLANEMVKQHQQRHMAFMNPLSQPSTQEEINAELDKMEAELHKTNANVSNSGTGTNNSSTTLSYNQYTAMNNLKSPWGFTNKQINSTAIINTLGRSGAAKQEVPVVRHKKRCPGLGCTISGA